MSRLSPSLSSAVVADPASITQLAAPSGGTGMTAGAYDTASNRDLAIVSINAARTDIALIRTQLIALITALEDAGIVTT